MNTNLDSRLIHREQMDLRGFNVVERDGDSIEISKIRAGLTTESILLWAKDIERLADFVERTDALNEERAEREEENVLRHMTLPPWFYAAKRGLVTLVWIVLTFTVGAFLGVTFGDLNGWFNFMTAAAFLAGTLFSQRHIQ